MHQNNDKQDRINKQAKRTYFNNTDYGFDRIRNSLEVGGFSL